MNTHLTGATAAVHTQVLAASAGLFGTGLNSLQISAAIFLGLVGALVIVIELFHQNTSKVVIRIIEFGFLIDFVVNPSFYAAIAHHIGAALTGM